MGNNWVSFRPIDLSFCIMKTLVLQNEYNNWKQFEGNSSWKGNGLFSTGNIGSILRKHLCFPWALSRKIMRLSTFKHVLQSYPNAWWLLKIFEPLMVQESKGELCKDKHSWHSIRRCSYLLFILERNEFCPKFVSERNMAASYSYLAKLILSYWLPIFSHLS